MYYHHDGYTVKSERKIVKPNKMFTQSRLIHIRYSCTYAVGNRFFLTSKLYITILNNFIYNY